MWAYYINGYNKKEKVFVIETILEYGENYLLCRYYEESESKLIHLPFHMVNVSEDGLLEFFLLENY